MAHELERLRAIRESTRAYAEKTQVEANEILKEFNVDDYNTLKLKKHSLLERLENLAELDNAILDKIEVLEINDELTEASTFRDKINLTIIEIDFVLDESQSGISRSTLSNRRNGPNVKLQPLKLKDFTGEPREWQTFWDGFSSAVHENDDVAEINKFQYLVGLLKGDAALAVAGLPVRVGNYKKAVTILKNRYGQKQIVIASHMDALMKLPSCTETNDVRKLRELYDIIEANVRGLESLGVESEKYGSLLIPVLQPKLPLQIQIEISRKIGGEDWSLTKLLEILRTELEARERCLKSVNPAATVKKPQNKLLPTASALFNDAENNRLARGTPYRSGTFCTYCKGNHNSIDCHIVSDRSARLAQLRKEGRCFICLRKGHIAGKCESKYRCNACHRSHHISLCERNSRSSKDAQQAQEKSLETKEVSNLHVNSAKSILLQTAQAIIYSPVNPQRRIVVRLIFDSGSQRSYVSERVRRYLDLPVIAKEQITIKTFGNSDGKTEILESVRIGIQDNWRENSQKKSLEIDTLAVPFICTPLVGQDIETTRDEFPRLAGLQLADDAKAETRSEVDILIGCDSSAKFFTGEVQIPENQRGPTAMNTLLGWVLSGQGVRKRTRLSDMEETNTYLLKVDCKSVEIEIGNQLEKFWDFESIGIRDKETVVESFTKNISFSDEKYSVSLPFRENSPVLPDNYVNTVRRLDSTVKRLRKEPKVLKECDSIVKEQLEKGVIEKVEVNKPVEPGQVHYLPGQIVTRKDALTTKIRMVFDASSKSHGVCLNDTLHTGPSLTEQLYSVLLRFRLRPIAIIADVEKAFLAIGVDENHRDYLRFLWLRNVDENDSEIVVYRFCSVPFGLCCSPFIMNSILQHHVKMYENTDTEFVKLMLNSFYCDDLSTGVNTVKEGIDLCLNAKKRYAEGNFNLRKWNSNSSELLSSLKSVSKDSSLPNSGAQNQIQMDDLSYAKISVGKFDEIETPTEQKVLGLNWNTETDSFTLKFGNIAEIGLASEPTKRTVLKTTATVFDPLGVISPSTLKAKLLFQDLCCLKMNWDDELSAEHKRIWTKWLNDLRDTDSVIINRYYFINAQEIIDSCELHGFADASTKAMGACIYAVYSTKIGTSSVLITGKSRVAPLKKISIPRLELTAAEVLSKLMDNVSRSLETCIKINEKHCWTDSLNTLYWIHTDKEMKQFVDNRVNKIRSLTSRDMWKHLPGVDNPADIASRGAYLQKLERSTLWWEGPNWLVQSSTFWPAQPKKLQPTEDGIKEMKSGEKVETINLLSSAEKQRNLLAIISVDRFSSSLKLFRVTAIVLRFIKKLKEKREKSTGNSLNNDDIDPHQLVSVEETNYAERLWIVEIQKELISDAKYSSWEKNLGLFRDFGGIIRCKGRLGNSPMEFEEKYPALLPRDHLLTRLIILRAHSVVKHGGVTDTLTQVREKFWIIKARQLIKKIIRHCRICKRFEGNHYKLPPISDLPEFRTEQVPAFCNVGVDFAGPLFVKQEGNNLTTKAYIALFSCCVTRAIHLEVVPDLTADSFILCLRRFISRRGIPLLLLSDNAKTFKKANLILKKLYELLRNAKVHEFLSERSITWRFILARAPWWGGMYERMVREVKRPLRKILRNACLTMDELTTIVIEIEATLNSRPLTYISEDDSGEPLTPSHLVLGRRVLNLPDIPDRSLADNSNSHSLFSRRLKHIATLLQHYWKRWRHEYLRGLREYHRNSLSRKVGENFISVGDAVIIHEENLPRSRWKMGKVLSLIAGKDGFVRGAKLKVISNKGISNVIERPLQKLFPLEVSEPKDQPGNEQQVKAAGSSKDNGQVRPRSRPQSGEPGRPDRPPRRQAALDADLLRTLRSSYS